MTEQELQAIRNRARTAELSAADFGQRISRTEQDRVDLLAEVDWLQHELGAVLSCIAKHGLRKREKSDE